MSVIIVPGQFRRDPHPVGRLAGTMLSVAAAGIADSNRFRRAKSYVADHAVVRIEVDTAVLRAVVAGSRDPYLVTVTTLTVAPPASTDPAAYRSDVTRLSPVGSELRFDCTCPDEANPCKHGLATLLAFGEEVVQRPELLLAWRCEPGAPHTRRDNADQADSGGGETERRPPSGPRPPMQRRPPPIDHFATPAWASFVGDPAAIPAAPLPAETGSALRPSAIDVTGAEELVAAMHHALSQARWR